MRARIAFKLAAIWLVVALPLTVILGLTYRQWYETRVSLVEEQRLGYARLSATSFRLLVAEIQRTMHLSGMDMTSRETSSVLTALELDRLESIYPAAYVALTDVHGTILAASEPGLVGRNLSGHEALSRALASANGTGIEPSEDGGNGIVGFHLAERIEAAPDRTAGAILLLVDVRQLFENFPISVPTGGISVIDSQGQVVFQNEDVQLALERDRWGDRFWFVKSAVSGTPAVTRDFEFPLGGQRIAAFVPIDGTGWAAGSAVIADEALAPFFGGLRWGIPFSALLAALGLFVASWISHRIRRSLVVLTDDAQRIGRGDLRRTVELGRTDEIGDLALSLEQARQNLESYVAENARLLERERESSRLNAGLTDVDSILHSTLAFGDILALVLERACEALGCDAAGVNLREGSVWVRAALVGLEPAFIGERMGDDDSPISANIRETLQPVIMDDVAADPRMPDAFAERYGIKSSMAFPLIARGSVVGVVFFNHLGVQQPFTDEQIDFATRLSLSLAFAHENARLY
ncbi:MAG TPA: GAF domain-containing protein, partial [Coriobacteriia bacterium]|nr:GAF domain-containing protein [Coriobacteriia bacterium]